VILSSFNAVTSGLRIHFLLLHALLKALDCLVGLFWVSILSITDEGLCPKRGTLCQISRTLLLDLFAFVSALNVRGVLVYGLGHELVASL